MQEQTLKTTPSWLMVFSGLLGCLFLAGIGYSQIDLVYRLMDEFNITNLIGGVVIMLLVSLALVCLGMALTFPLITITDTQLIYRRPALFYSREINLSEINGFQERVVLINPSYRSREIKIYEKRQLFIRLGNGKAVRIDSLEIPEYAQVRIRLRSERPHTSLNTALSAERRKMSWAVAFLAVLVVLLYYAILA